MLITLFTGLANLRMHADALVWGLSATLIACRFESLPRSDSDRLMPLCTGLAYSDYASVFSAYAQIMIYPAEATEDFYLTLSGWPHVTIS